MSFQQLPVTLGFIPANRGFFSAELAAKMRQQTIDAMQKLGVKVVAPQPGQTKPAASRIAKRPNFAPNCSAGMKK